MKIIITETFSKLFSKEFKNYNFELENLVEILKKTKLINLKDPYIKVKLTLNKVSLRWIVIKNDNDSIIPIFMTLKKNKIIGDNLVLNKKVLEKINNLLWKMSKDFEKSDIREY